MFKSIFSGNRNTHSGRGRGLGGGTKPGSGPTGQCVCPKCGFVLPHNPGERCLDLPCPKCGARMTRK